MLAAAQGVACWYASTELDGSGKTDMPAPNAIRRAAMIPSRTTFHMAVGAGTHVMQRQTVPVLATWQFTRGEGSVGASLAGGGGGSAPRGGDAIWRQAPGWGPVANA